MPALFRTVLEVKEQAGPKGRDPLTYKNIKTALSALKVEAFLKEPVVVKVEGTEDEEHYRIGEIMYQNEDGTFEPSKVTKVKLDNPTNRERFIHEFPKYLAYAKTVISDNSGLDALAYTNTFRSVKSVLAIPKLKGSNVDNADAALIYDGFRELKTIDNSLSKMAEETSEQFAARVEQ